MGLVEALAQLASPWGRRALAWAFGVGVTLLVSLPILAVIPMERKRRLRILVGGMFGSAYAWFVGVLTLLPDQDWSELCVGRRGGKLRLSPLAGIRRSFVINGSGGALQFLRSFEVLQFAANIMLFVPAGVFTAVVIRSRPSSQRIRGAVLVGLCGSIAVEASQYTGLWGMYRCGIRVADVDDVLANVLGAFLGAMAAVLLVRRETPIQRPMP